MVRQKHKVLESMGKGGDKLEPRGKDGRPKLPYLVRADVRVEVKGGEIKDKLDDSKLNSYHLMAAPLSTCQLHIVKSVTFTTGT